MKIVGFAGQRFRAQSKSALSLLLMCTALSFSAHAKTDRAVITDQNKVDQNKAVIVPTKSEVPVEKVKVVEPVKKVALLPSIKILSSKCTSTPKYMLCLSSNLSGNLLIKCNGKDSNFVIEKSGIYYKVFQVTKGINTFNLVFIPDSNKTDTLKVQHILDYKILGSAGGIVYVSSVGNDTAKGTLNDPLDIYTAVEYLEPGQTILLANGTYRLPRPLIIEKWNNGVAGKLKTLKGSGNVVLDFSAASEGLNVFGNYWKFYGFDVTKGAKGGIRVFGNYNILELLNTYVNGGSGLQLSGYPAEKIDSWPSYNLVLNCESYNNKDASENEADGFAAKVACGVGNVFRGCIAHNNSNDGWNLYSRLELGAIGVVVIENCISYGNGILSNGYITKGDGNGFKLGGEGFAVPHVLKNSLSFGNRAMGITNNYDPEIVVENNTSVDNGLPNYDFSTTNNAKPHFTVNNNISYRTLDGKNDRAVDSLKSLNNYFYFERSIVNSEGQKLTDADFKSIKVETFMRNTNGTIAPVKFMALKNNTKMASGAHVNDLAKVTAIPAAVKSADSLMVLVAAKSKTADSLKAVAAAAKLKTADSLKAVAAAKLKTADSLKAIAAAAKLKTADSLKAVAAAAKLKTADSLKAIAAEKLKTADSLKAIAAAAKLKTADSLKAIAAAMSKTADSLKAIAAAAKLKTADSLKAIAAAKSKTADSLKAIAAAAKLKTADSLKAIAAEKLKTADSLKTLAAAAKLKTADSLKAVAAAKSKTTDSLKTLAAAISADSLKARAAAKLKTTDSLKALIAAKSKTADSLKALAAAAKSADSLNAIAASKTADSSKALAASKPADTAKTTAVSKVVVPAKSADSTKTPALVNVSLPAKPDSAKAPASAVKTSSKTTKPVKSTTPAEK
jgi:hypothetical protein